MDQYVFRVHVTKIDASKYMVMKKKTEACEESQTAWIFRAICPECLIVRSLHNWSPKTNNAFAKAVNHYVIIFYPVVVHLLN